MFSNLGSMEILFLGVLLIILFGGKKLPEIGKFLGEGLKEFKKATKDIDSEKPKNLDLLNKEDEHSKISQEKSVISQKKD